MVSGDTLRDAQQIGTDTSLILDGVIPGTPCTNLADIQERQLEPKQSKDKASPIASTRPGSHRRLMFYATWSNGFRPGGINRRRVLRRTIPIS